MIGPFRRTRVCFTKSLSYDVTYLSFAVSKFITEADLKKIFAVAAQVCVCMCVRMYACNMSVCMYEHLDTTDVNVDTHILRDTRWSVLQAPV